MRSFIRRRHVLGSVTLAALAVALVTLLGPASADPGADSPDRKVIAHAVVNAFCAKVTATREGRGRATVELAAFEGSEPQGPPVIVGRKGGWFWKILRERNSVLRFRIARPIDRHAQIGAERIALRLLVTPSVGPSETYRFAVEDGSLVAVTD